MTQEHEDTQRPASFTGERTLYPLYFDPSFSDDMWPQQRGSLEARMNTGAAATIERRRCEPAPDRFRALSVSCWMRA